MSSPRLNDLLGNEDLIYLTMLTAMYNNNNTQIQNLQRANDTIRSSILSIINRNVNNIANNQNNALQNLSLNTPPPLNTPLTPEIPRNFLRTNLSPPRAHMNNRRRPILQNDFLVYWDSFFSPIPIYPTPTQIEAATRNVRFSDIIRPINTSCPISLETFNDNSQVTMIRHCGHIFNRDMLNSWFQNHSACPVCRYDIRDYVPNNTVNSEEQQNVRTTLTTENATEERNSNLISDNDGRPPTPDVPRSQLNDRISQDTQERITNFLFGQLYNDSNTSTNNSNNFNGYT